MFKIPLTLSHFINKDNNQAKESKAGEESVDRTKSIPSRTKVGRIA